MVLRQQIDEIQCRLEAKPAQKKIYPTATTTGHATQLTNKKTIYFDNRF